MEGAEAAPLPRTIAYPQKIKTVKDKKTYKHNLLKKNPETLMSDYFQKGDRSTITNLLLYQERSQKGDSGCASEKLGVPHLLSD